MYKPTTIPTSKKHAITANSTMKTRDKPCAEELSMLSLKDVVFDDDKFLCDESLSEKELRNCVVLDAVTDDEMMFKLDGDAVVAVVAVVMLVIKTRP